MLVPEGASGQRCWSPAPRIGSILITSAPSWARVRPHSGEATKLEISRTVSPSSGAPRRGCAGLGGTTPPDPPVAPVPADWSTLVPPAGDGGYALPGAPAFRLAGYLMPV